MFQADAAGRTKGEKKREKTSTSSKENFEQNNNGGSGTKREKKRVSPSNVNQRLLSGSCSRAVLLSVEREQSRGGQKKTLMIVKHVACTTITRCSSVSLVQLLLATSA